MILEEEKTKEKEETKNFNLDQFNNIIVNSNEISKIINSIKNFLEKFLELNSNQYKNFIDLFEKFSSVNYKDSTYNTPIYTMKISIEEIILFNINYLQSINQNLELFNSIQKQLTNLHTIIKEASKKYNDFSNNENFNSDETKNLLKPIMESMNDFETRIINEYINEQYDKHISGINNTSKIDDLVLKIKYLENTLNDYLTEKKKKYFEELKEFGNNYHKICNKLNQSFEKYINYLKEQNKLFNTKLENFEKNVKTRKLMSDKNKNFTISKSDKASEKQNININKYRIKILNNNKIYLDKKDFNNNFEHMTKVKEKKNKDNKKNTDLIKDFQNQKEDSRKECIFLTEKDIYEIISKLYSYNFLTLEKSDYDLDIEKGKLEACTFSTEILSYNGDSEENKKLLDDKYDEIIKSIDNKIANSIENFLSFFKVLNNYRANGMTKFSDKLYDIIIYIYNKAQDFLLKNDNQQLANILLILSQTYYKEIDGNKIYITKEIHTHELFKKKEFWKNILISKIEEEIKNKVTQIELTKIKKNDIIYSKIIPFIGLMKEFNISDDNIKEIFNDIFDKYECSQETRIQILSCLNIGNNINENN